MNDDERLSKLRFELKLAISRDDIDKADVLLHAIMKLQKEKHFVSQENAVLESYPVR